MIALTFMLKMWRCMNYEEKLSSANVSTSKTHMPLVRLSEMLENRDCGTVILLHHQVQYLQIVESLRSSYRLLYLTTLENIAPDLLLTFKNLNDAADDIFYCRHTRRSSTI